MKIKLTDNGMYKAPYRAHDNDCGADVYAPEDVLIRAHETTKIDLKFAIDVPVGYGGFIFPRSGLASRGLVCELPPIDPLYSGNIHAIITNNSDEPRTITKGDRIGQLVIMPVIVCDFISEYGDTRGAGGFGSTGK